MLSITLKIAFTIIWFLLCAQTSFSLDNAEKKGRGPFIATRLLIYIALFGVIYLFWASPMVKQIISYFS